MDDYDRYYQRQYRRAAREAGMCWNCKRRPACVDSIRCAECRAKHNKKARDARAVMRAR